MLPDKAMEGAASTELDELQTQLAASHETLAERQAIWKATDEEQRDAQSRLAVLNALSEECAKEIQVLKVSLVREVIATGADCDIEGLAISRSRKQAKYSLLDESIQHLVENVFPECKSRF